MLCSSFLQNSCKFWLIFHPIRQYFAIVSYAYSVLVFQSIFETAKIRIYFLKSYWKKENSCIFFPEIKNKKHVETEM